MKIPKTPIEFDYDLWTMEDGKCMVRVKATGEVTEVDREIMKALRAEEKKLRRSYGSDGNSEDTPLQRRATMNSMRTCPAVWTRRFSAEASFPRQCLLITSGSR